MKRRYARLLGVAAALLVAAACGDGGPSGPGNLEASVDGGSLALGAAVIQVTGQGITGFGGAGGTRVFSNQTGPTTHRVVVVGQTPGRLNFTIAVEDRGAGLPTLAVVEAVDGANADVQDVASLKASVSR
ncbi:MAG: hypothetical protein D6701_13250 [Gemmatimonadetes bacterium]|nr:MAG: hypothetical protein D6701_13250 [Gemmatimonadota bacterium]